MRDGIELNNVIVSSIIFLYFSFFGASDVQRAKQENWGGASAWSSALKLGEAESKHKIPSTFKDCPNFVKGDFETRTPQGDSRLNCSESNSTKTVRNLLSQAWLRPVLITISSIQRTESDPIFPTNTRNPSSLFITNMASNSKTLVWNATININFIININCVWDSDITCHIRNDLGYLF